MSLRPTNPEVIFEDYEVHCLCGRVIYASESYRFGEFCSAACQREYDEMMEETWDKITELLLTD